MKRAIAIAATMVMLLAGCSSADGDSDSRPPFAIEDAVLGDWSELPFLMVEVGSFESDSGTRTAITPWYYAVGGGTAFKQDDGAVLTMPSLRQLGLSTDRFSGGTHIESWYEVENISVSRIVEGRGGRTLGVLTHTIDLAEMLLLDLDGDLVVDVFDYVQPTVGEFAASLTPSGDEFLRIWFEGSNPFCSDSFEGLGSYDVPAAFRVDMCEMKVPTSFEGLDLESSFPGLGASEGEFAVGAQLVDPPAINPMEDTPPSVWATLTAAVKTTRIYHSLTKTLGDVTSGPHLASPEWRLGRDLSSAPPGRPRLAARVPSGTGRVSASMFKSQPLRVVASAIFTRHFGAQIVDAIAVRTIGIPVTPGASHEFAAEIVHQTAQLIEQEPGGSECAGARRCYRSELPPETFGLYFEQSELGPLPRVFIPGILSEPVLGPGLFVDPTVGQVEESTAGNAAEIDPDVGSVAGSGCSWTFTAQEGVVDGCGSCDTSAGGFAALGEVVACKAANAAEEIPGPLTDAERQRLQGPVETDPGISAEISE